MTEPTAPSHTSPTKTGNLSAHTPMLQHDRGVTSFVNADKAFSAIFNPPIRS